MAIDTNHFKKILERERGLVETELRDVGRVNPANPKDWEATGPSSDTTSADRNEVADNIDTYEENTAISSQLEIRLNDIKKALERIDQGTYGICSVCGKEIEQDRLEANPAASTCKTHMNV